MDFARQVKAAVDIASVVGGYVRLKRQSSVRFVGLCPFHQEKTPSFYVSVDRGMYKCFGCGVSGDVFKFVQEMESLSFWEALKLLAESHGIPLPKRSEAADDETRLRAAVHQMHDVAAEHFRKLLQSDAGRPAREYLAKRGLHPEMVEQFGLGYADPGGQALTRRLQADFPPEPLRQSGLVKERETGGFYDLFRGRLMFPIHSETGKVIGFGGRALNDEDQPKYLNSPETPIYKKREVLYNLHRAKSAIRRQERVVLVEGYMDVMGVYAAGVHEVVASCGTALVESQVRVLKRHSDTIVLNFDPDAAGARAMVDRIPLLLRENLRVRVLDLGGDLDPDEFIKHHGAEAYQQRLSGAIPYFQWLAAQARQRYGASAEGRMDALRSILPALNDVVDGAERLAIADELADLLGISPEMRVRTGYRNSVVQNQGSKKRPAAAAPKLPTREALLLEALLDSAEVRAEVLARVRDLGSWRSFRSRAIFETLFRMVEAGAEIDFASLEARLEPAQKDLLHELLSADERGESAKEDSTLLEQALACVDRLEVDGRQTLREELKSRIRAAERAGQVSEALQLMAELAELERES
jgi:DNA primase